MNIIEKLETTKVKTMPYFDLPEAELNKSYAPGKWNVRYILHHLADAETVFYDRICRVISEPRQVLWAFDQDAWANKLDYGRVPLSLAKPIYRSMREAIIYYAQQHYEQDGQREFVHSETGVKTLKDIFDKMAWHNQHHLDQIASALTQG